MWESCHWLWFCWWFSKVLWFPPTITSRIFEKLTRSKFYLLFEKQILFAFWETNFVCFLRNKFYLLFEKQILFAFWETNFICFLRNKFYLLFEKQILFAFWETNFDAVLGRSIMSLYLPYFFVNFLRTGHRYVKSTGVFPLDPSSHALQTNITILIPHQGNG